MANQTIVPCPKSAVVTIIVEASVAHRKNQDSKLMMPLNTRVILVRPTFILINPLVEVASRTEGTAYIATDEAFDLRCELRRHGIVHEAIYIAISLH